MNENENQGFTEVFAWGSDRSGQLGLGTKQGGRCYSIPRLCSFNVTIQQISCGEEHSAFIANDSMIYTMGSNSEGRLGVGDRNVRSSSTPCLIESLLMHKPVAVSCGWGHTAVVMENGELYTWGAGEFGALGIKTLESQWFPVKINFPQEKSKIYVVGVSCGTRHTGIIDDRGKLFMCGAGDAGQLGTGRREMEISFVQIAALTERVKQIGAGTFHTLVLTANSRVFAMGGNNFGQLGTGIQRSSNIPVLVEALEGKKIAKIAAGHHSAAVSESGELYVWGSGVFGEFLTPQKITSLKAPVKDIDVGGNFGAVLDINGVLHTWGNNTSGELGVGDYESRATPFPVASLQGKTVSQISCGGSFMIALGKTLKTPNSASGLTSPIKYEAPQFNAPAESLRTSQTTPFAPTSAYKKGRDSEENKYSPAAGRKLSDVPGGRPRAYEPFSPEADITSFRSRKERAVDEPGAEDPLIDAYPRRAREGLRGPIDAPHRSISPLATTANVGGTSSMPRSPIGAGGRDDYIVSGLQQQKNELEKALNQEHNKRKNLEKDFNELKSHLDNLRHGSGGLSEMNNILDATRKEHDKLSSEFARESEKAKRTELAFEDERRLNMDLRKNVEDEKRNSHDLKNQIELLRESIRALEQEIEFLKHENHRYMSEARSTITEKSGENLRLQDILSDYQAKIESEIEDKHLIMNEKAKEIARLNDMINDLENRIYDEGEEKRRMNEYYKSEINRFSDTIRDYEVKFDNELDEKKKLNGYIQQDQDRIADLESQLAGVQQKYGDERNASKYLNDQLNNERSITSRLEEDLLVQRDRRDEEQKRNESLMFDLNMLQKEHEHKMGDAHMNHENLKNAYNDLKAENKDLINKVEDDMKEFEAMKQEIIAWKQHVNKLGEENTDLKSMIEDLEVKNKKLVETLNLHLYNRATEYKERTLQALKNSESPMRIQRVLSTGHKFRDRTTPSPTRLAEIIANEEKRGPQKLDDINNMVRNERDTVKNIKKAYEEMKAPYERENLGSSSSNDLSRVSKFDADYLQDRGEHYIEEDPKVVKSNAAIINLMDQYEKEDPINQPKTMKVNLGRGEDNAATLPSDQNRQLSADRNTRPSPSKTLKRAEDPYEEERSVLAKAGPGGSMYTTPTRSAIRPGGGPMAREELDQSRKDQLDKGQRVEEHHQHVTESAGRLLNILGITSPIRKKKAGEILAPEQDDSALGSSLGKYARGNPRTPERVIHGSGIKGRESAQRRYEGEEREQTYNASGNTGSNQPATSITSGMALSSLNDVKNRLNSVKENNKDLENKLFEYEKRLMQAQGRS